MNIPDPQSNAAMSDLFDFVVGWKERHGIADGVEECRLLACFLAGRLDVAASLKACLEMPPYDDGAAKNPGSVCIACGYPAKDFICSRSGCCNSD